MSTITYVRENLDRNPVAQFGRAIRKLIIVWLIIVFFFALILAISPIIQGWTLAVYWILFIGLIAVPGLLLMAMKFGQNPSLCDDMDLTGIEKRIFFFTTSDGLKMSGYEYRPVGKTVQKVPVIIGIHGWFANHRRTDRFCLPLVRQAGFYYYTFDARGHGSSPGDKSDFRQLEDTKEFIDLIVSLPHIDKKRIGVVGTSMGAAKVAIAAYPHPDVKALAIISGCYDLEFTELKLPMFYRIMMKLSGMKIPAQKDILKSYNGLEKMNPDGVVLRGETVSTPNAERVLLTYCQNDPLVHPENSVKAIQCLNLPPSNFRAFPRGRHYSEGNEYDLAVELYCFFTKHCGIITGRT